MYKTDVIRAVAKETKLPQRAVAKALSATLGVIEQALANGQYVTFPGFGTFYIRTRRKGMIKSFATGLMVDVPAMTQPRFRAGEVLKRSVRRESRQARRGTKTTARAV